MKKGQDASLLPRKSFRLLVKQGGQASLSGDRRHLWKPLHDRKHRCFSSGVLSSGIGNSVDIAAAEGVGRFPKSQSTDVCRLRTSVKHPTFPPSSYPPALRRGLEPQPRRVKLPTNASPPSFVRAEVSSRCHSGESPSPALPLVDPEPLIPAQLHALDRAKRRVGRSLEDLERRTYAPTHRTAYAAAIRLRCAR